MQVLDLQRKIKIILRKFLKPEEFKEIEKFSKIVTIEELKENDYNLSPSRYVSIIEEEKYRSISEIKSDLEKLEEKRKRIDQELSKILEEV